MIIIGYQGIGKSTLARKSKGFIDLESSSFYVNGKRPTDWHYYYNRIAENLSQQGYVVFVSSHMPVRDFFKTSDERAIIICPAKELKDDWIQKLRTRYENNRTEKNLRALRNAEERFEENIDELMHDGIKTILIDDMRYDLENLIRWVISVNLEIDFHDRQIWEDVTETAAMMEEHDGD